MEFRRFNKVDSSIMMYYYFLNKKSKEVKEDY